MRFNIHPVSPEGRKINQIKSILEHDGVMVFPTDSVYAIGCAMNSRQAVDRVCKLRKLDPVKANLTFHCNDISQIASVTAPISNAHFRILKRNTPGPFTYILRSNHKIPKLFKNKKRTIGARIPDSNFLRHLITAMEQPIMSLSLKFPDDAFHENDFDAICENWENRVDAVIESGVVPNDETAIIDFTQDDVIIHREGVRPLII